MIVKGLTWYYVTRLAMVGVWLVVATIGGLPLWASAVPAAGMIAYFLWLPRGGRFVVREDQALTPMRRDERGEAINARAAKWALVVETLLVGVATVWAALAGQTGVSAALGLVQVATWLTYLVAQTWLSR